MLEKLENFKNDCINAFIRIKQWHPQCASVRTILVDELLRIHELVKTIEKINQTKNTHLKKVDLHLFVII